MTASAIAPPAPHNKLSRLPWNHRVSLEPNTNCEYAQNQKTITKYFFGFLVTRLLQFEDEQQREAETVCRLRCCVSQPDGAFRGSYVEQSLPAIGFRVNLSTFSYARPHLSPSN